MSCVVAGLHLSSKANYLQLCIYISISIPTIVIIIKKTSQVLASSANMRKYNRQFSLARSLSLYSLWLAPQWSSKRGWIRTQYNILWTGGAGQAAWIGEQNIKSAMNENLKRRRESEWTWTTTMPARRYNIMMGRSSPTVLCIYTYVSFLGCWFDVDDGIFRTKWLFTVELLVFFLCLPAICPTRTVGVGS